MSYLYVVNSHKPTAVHHSASCSFTGPDDKNLLLAKCNVLEIHLLREDGLKLLQTVPIFGRIVGLEPYRPLDATTDSVFILTDQKKFCILSYDTQNTKVITQTVGSVKERKGRDSELGQRAFMDPDFRAVGLQLYDSSIKIVPLDKAGMHESFNISLEETRILDMKFIHGCSRPTLCLLYEDNRRTRHVKTIAIDMREKTSITSSLQRDNVEFTACMLIPVPSPINGVLVVGINTITYVSAAGVVQTVEISPALPTTYCQIDPAGSRYLIGNVKGNMLVVALVVDTNFKVVSITTDILGNTTIAETINYLDNGVVYVGSSLGDSQLVKLLSQPTEGNGHIDVLDSYLNIGPILDMCVVDNEKNGTQKQIVTCSGYDRIGSLRVIRSGIGIHEQASLEIPGIKNLWSLRESETAEFDKFLIQSFVGETRVLSIDGEEMGEIEIPTFNATLPSLYCGNMAGGLMLQVTAAGVRLINCTSFELVFEQFFAKNITVAIANLTQVVLALSGGELMYLELSTDFKQLVIVQQTVLDQDIACLSFKPTSYETVMPVATSSASEDASTMDVDAVAPIVNYLEKTSILAVGMWTDNTVRLFAVPSLEEIARSHLETTTQSRDVVLVTFEEKMFVFVGMGDGGLITYTLDASSGSVQLTNRRKGVLGTRPVTFTRFVSSSSNELCVFAACDRPTVIYIRNGKVLFSMLDLKFDEVTNMAPFHSELFPDCLALSSDDILMIGTVEDIQKMHVRTVPLDEGPRRIAYSPEHNVYAVLTEKTVDNEHGGESKNRILFFDEAFEQIGTFDLDYLEQGCSLSLCHFADCDKPYFVVGTGQVVAEELEPSRGRILIFDILESKKCILIAERDTKAAVYSLTDVSGRLAAGVANRVHIFKFVKKDEQINIGSYSIQAELQPECSVAEHIMVLYLKSHGEYLVVGDVHRSISLLKYKPKESSLEEVARDFNSNMMRAVEVMTSVEDHYLGADDHANLFVVKYRGNVAANTATAASGANTAEENQSKLTITGEYHLGDYVNVMRQGTIVTQPLTIDTASSSSNAAPATNTSSSMDIDGTNSNSPEIDIFHPNYRTVTGFPVEKNSVLFGTISGMIGSIIALNESSFQFFQAVQSAMRKVYKPVEGLLHEEWRIFQNDYRTGSVKNVIDGDLVEALLDLDRASLEIVTKEVNDQLTSLIQPSGSIHGGASSSNTESAAVLMTSLATGRINLSPEEILRRVEDISRLH